jgi:RNA polymerase sigma factor (sigma-70 family)
MDRDDRLAQRFEENRPRLRAVAYRMLGSTGEADDAVQEAWLRLSRADAGAIDNLGGWLTTVVARVSLDMMRKRKSLREQPLDADAPEPAAGAAGAFDPEQEALLADSVGLAMLVVLDTLGPAERLAFVLHDMFAVPFDDIASILERSPEATRQLASRGRRRVQGRPAVPEDELGRRRDVVDAYLAAARDGDFDALVAVLDPDVVLRADRSILAPGQAREQRGAAAVARQALARRAQFAEPALIDGSPGLLLAPFGRLRLVLRFTVAHGRIAEIDVVGDPERLQALDLAVLGDRPVSR